MDKPKPTTETREEAITRLLRDPATTVAWYGWLAEIRGPSDEVITAPDALVRNLAAHNRAPAAPGGNDDL